jgi:CRP/FNR family cyclic AMP-dependent transcriptional regulator
MAKKAGKLSFDPKVFLATVDGGRTLSNYRKNEVIFTQGDPADAVLYIQKGQVKITVVSEQGKEAVVAVLGPDEFCGEGCLNGHPRRLSTAVAMTECEVMRLEKTLSFGSYMISQLFPICSSHVCWRIPSGLSRT